MSKYTQQTYDVTQDAVNYILTQMDNFYLAHPMPEKEGDPEDSVAIYFNVLFAFQRQTVAFYDIDKKAWRSMRIDTLWSWKRAMKLV